MKKVYLIISFAIMLTGSLLAQSKLNADLQQKFETGKSFYSSDKYDSAYVYFCSVLDAQPGYAPALYYIGLIFQDVNMRDSAEVYYNLAIKADSSYADPYSDLSTLVMDKGQLERGLALASRSVTLDSTFISARLNYAIALYRLSRMDEATQQFKRVAQIEPERLGSLAVSEWKDADNPHIAEYLFKILIEVHPNDPTALFDLGGIDRTNGDLATAESHLYQALQVCDTSDDLCLVIYGSYFRLLLDESEYQKVLAQAGLKVGASNPSPHYFMAIAYYQLGDSLKFAEEAKLYFELKGKPEPPSIESWVKENLKPKGDINVPKQ